MANIIDAHSRVFGLDLLRAYAIFCVVYGHGYYLVQNAIPKVIYWIPVLDGVTMFFVLSGFLIGRILLRTVSHSEFDGKMLLDFWVRRWFRTLPNYFFVLISLVLVWYFTDRLLPDDVYKYFVFSQNLKSSHPDFFAEAWSLAVEEWFYLVIPIPLYLAAKWSDIDKKKAVLVLVAVCIVLVTVFRIYRAYRYGFSGIGSWDQNLRKQVITRFDSLMYGVLGAYLSMYRYTEWRRFSKMAFFLGLAVLLFDKAYFAITDSIFYLSYFRLTVTPVGTLLLLPFLSLLRRTEGGFVKVVTFVSLTSYSMYLLNYTSIQNFIVPAIMWRLSNISELIASNVVCFRYVIYWILTVMCSYFLWRYFEYPMTSLRERFRVGCVPEAKVFGSSRVNPTYSLLAVKNDHSK